MRPGAETLAGTGQAPPSGAQEGALGAGLPPGVLAIGGQPVRRPAWGFEGTGTGGAPARGGGSALRSGAVAGQGGSVSHGSVYLVCEEPPPAPALPVGASPTSGGAHSTPDAAGHRGAGGTPDAAGHRGAGGTLRSLCSACPTRIRPLSSSATSL